MTGRRKDTIGFKVFRWLATRHIGRSLTPADNKFLHDMYDIMLGR